MHAKLLRNEAVRTYALVLDSGDAVVDELLAFADTHDLSAAHFTAIGAFRRATLGFYDLEAKEFAEIPVEEQTEVLAFTGTLARRQGAPILHAHAVLGRPDGSTIGGHVLAATVRPTLELMLTEEPGILQRAHDEATGLYLLDLS